MQAVYDTLAFAGENESNMVFIGSPDGAHSEWFWAREYPAAYDWLFGDLILSTKHPREKKGKVFPNPASETLWINGDEPYVHVTIYSLPGEVMLNADMDQDYLDISNLPPGIYFLEIKSFSGPDRWISRFVKE